ncbi:ecdysone 20-monooxygenase-like isoform X2 [Rhopalosiphum padi]|uniref:ecdysone 20-monooxygenase-like isoform X2 n=1 Tax=Rhopalosiphum padi TaxID=40932 RepID=UPI00298DEDFC|nr:ecdysone 20-monooxygenase-like isoform X2 [Rhopalosiphum padi]
MVLQKKYWTKIEGACCILVACITALIKLVLKFIIGTYSDLKNQPDAQLKIYKTVADIPGPRSLPVFGTRWIYWKFGLYKLNAVHLAYKDMFIRYGDIICEEALWNIPIISVKDKDFIERVLRNSGKYPIRPPNEVTANYRKSRPDRYTNTGLVNEQGEVWAMLRNKLTPELTSPRTIRRFLPEVNQLADDFINLISQARDTNNEVKIFESYCNRMGLESTCTLILGRRFGFLDGDVSETATRLADSVTSQFRASQEAFYGLPLWKLIPTKAYKEFVASEDALYDIVSEIVDSALIDEEQSCTDVRSVFVSILQASELDNRDKKAAIIDYIAAGIKTLGNTLVFLLYLVAKHPDVQEKIYNEISLLAPAGTPITAEYLHKATYLHACISEAHRLLPTAPCIARVLESEVNYENYRLPSGTVVLLHTGLACLDDKNFKDATSYKPERWLDDLTKKSPFLVAPFGCGKRMCPGKRFIELELQIVLAKMVKQFHIDFKGQLKTEFEFLLTPSNANFILRDRNC